MYIYMGLWASSLFYLSLAGVLYTCDFMYMYMYMYVCSPAPYILFSLHTLLIISLPCFPAPLPPSLTPPPSTHAVHVEDPPDPEFGEVTLRSRQRLRTSDPSHLKALRHTVLSKTMRVRMRASTVVPGVSEGVLPPNAEPVTSGEALHHLAKQVSAQSWAEWPPGCA